MTNAKAAKVLRDECDRIARTYTLNCPESWLVIHDAMKVGATALEREDALLDADREREEFVDALHDYVRAEIRLNQLDAWYRSGTQAESDRLRDAVLALYDAARAGRQP